MGERPKFATHEFISFYNPIWLTNSGLFTRASTPEFCRYCTAAVLFHDGFSLAAFISSIQMPFSLIISLKEVNFVPPSCEPQQTTAAACTLSSFCIWASKGCRIYWLFFCSPTKSLMQQRVFKCYFVLIKKKSACCFWLFSVLLNDSSIFTDTRHYIIKKSPLDYHWKGSWEDQPIKKITIVFSIMQLSFQ